MKCVTMEVTDVVVVQSLFPKSHRRFLSLWLLDTVGEIGEPGVGVR